MQSFSSGSVTRRRGRAGWILAGLLFTSTHAYAQGTDDMSIAAARQLGKSAVERYQAGEIPAALEKLQRAYALYDAPTLGLWYGRALERSGRLVEASERYRQVAMAELSADATSAFKQAKAEAKQALEAVLPKLPQLTIDAPGLDGAQLRLTLDDVALNAAVLGISIPVNPGAHVLRATLGTQAFEQKLELREAEPQRATIVLPPEPPPAAPEPTGLGKSKLAPVTAPARARAQPAAAPVPRAQILKLMQGMLPQIGACAHGNAGKAVASVTIRGVNGRVDKGTVKLDPSFVKRLIPSSLVTRERMVELYESCMTRVVANTQFPSFEAPQLELQYPFNFAPPPRQQKDSERPTQASR